MNDLIVKPVADAVEPLGKALGGTLADFWQGILGDRVTAWRIRNAAAIDKKLRENLATTGTELALDNLPEGMAFRWFERATEADEPVIQDLFAKLLANAADGNEDAQRKRNIELVSNLTPDDARLLEYVVARYREVSGVSQLRVEPFRMNYDVFFMSQYKSAGFVTLLPIDALVSLGVLRFEKHFKRGRRVFAPQPRSLDDRRDIEIDISGALDQEEVLLLTEVGRSLLSALFPVEMSTNDGRYAPPKNDASN